MPQFPILKNVFLSDVHKGFSTVHNQPETVFYMRHGVGCSTVDLRVQINLRLHVMMMMKMSQITNSDDDQQCLTFT